DSKPQLERELHLNRKHLPHANKIDAHYCARWAGLKTLKKIHANPGAGNQMQVQISRYHNSDDRYLVISMGRMVFEDEGLATSTCLGILINNRAKRKIKWLADSGLEELEVNVLCEKCDIPNCKERQADPEILQKRQYRKLIREKLNNLH
ncbi:MAG: hypothetical protein ACPF8V_08395, partial [Luteibaculum sp.]